MADFKHSEMLHKFTFSYDKSKKFNELVLGRNKHGFLLSVLKKYTNNIYFGASTVFLFLGDEPTIFKDFKCKDRGYTEELVDNKDEFVKLILDKDIEPNELAVERSKTMYNVKEDHNLGTINGRDFTLEYTYRGDDYYCTNFMLTNPDAVYRGLYFDKPNEHDLELFKETACLSFSNVYHEVNTDYSNIKVFENET